MIRVASPGRLGPFFAVDDRYSAEFRHETSRRSSSHYPLHHPPQYFSTDGKSRGIGLRGFPVIRQDALSILPSFPASFFSSALAATDGSNILSLPHIMLPESIQICTRRSGAEADNAKRALRSPAGTVYIFCPSFVLPPPPRQKGNPQTVFYERASTRVVICGGNGGRVI